MDGDRGCCGAVVDQAMEAVGIVVELTCSRIGHHQAASFALGAIVAVFAVAVEIGF